MAAIVLRKSWSRPCWAKLPLLLWSHIPSQKRNRDLYKPFSPGRYSSLERRPQVTTWVRMHLSRAGDQDGDQDPEPSESWHHIQDMSLFKCSLRCRTKEVLDP